MTEIKRDRYLNQLVSFQWDGQVKVITGIRRCGKSYLLRVLFRNHLLSHGVGEEQIISIELDLAKNIRFRNPLEMASFVRHIVEVDDKQYYLFIDEIQMSDEVDNPFNPSAKKITFYDALNDLRDLQNLDIYVTGSNSRMLSTDILTEFRGRSDEVRLHPLCFAEFYSAVGGDKRDAFDAFSFYGGMPMIVSRPDDTAKMQYLQSLFNEVYLKDIVERKKIEREDVLALVLDLLCSSIGSLTNPKKITDTLHSRANISVSQNTIKAYLGHLTDAFLFSESKRYDVKGKAYFDSPSKFYCEDIGLRNARLGFRQLEMPHIMENLLYNELIGRGFSVDVGIVYLRVLNQNGNSVRSSREIDFIVTKGGKKAYIQSVFAMETEEKKEAETRPFFLTGDVFPKILVHWALGKRWYDETGILHVSILDFLLDASLV